MQPNTTPSLFIISSFKCTSDSVSNANSRMAFALYFGWSTTIFEQCEAQFRPVKCTEYSDFQKASQRKWLLSIGRPQ
jgi:hypothetical protein